MKQVAWTVGVLLSTVVGAELIAWTSRVQDWFLRRTSQLLPPQDARRYLEEWRTELRQLPNGPVTRILYVTGIWLHRRGLARTLGVAHANPLAMRSRKTFDKVSSAVLLLLVTPLFLVIMITVRFLTRGPVFSNSVRVDSHGHHYVVRTFRTTAISNVSTNQPQGITKIGSFLRKTALDELPILLSMMKGDITFSEQSRHALADWRSVFGITGKSNGNDGARE